MTSRKYHNTPTLVDGIKFASAKEARTYQSLKLLERGKVISDLKLQPRFPLVVAGHKICVYVADFLFIERGKKVACDAKGYRTDVFRIKAKLFNALYPDIELREV